MGKAVGAEPDLVANVTKKRQVKEGGFALLGAGLILGATAVYHAIKNRTKKDTSSYRGTI